MQLTETGFILYVAQFEACVKFYENVLGLPVLYRKVGLVCFAFGGSYLMVEVDDRKGVKPRANEEPNRTCLRMNVVSTRECEAILSRAAVPFSSGTYDWGSVVKFKDPAGNLLAFRSSAEHVEDARNFATDNR